MQSSKLGTDKKIIVRTAFNLCRSMCGSSTNTALLYMFDRVTHRGRNGSAPKTKHTVFTNVWHNTEKPAPQNGIQQYICILKTRTTPLKTAVFIMWTAWTTKLNCKTD